MEESLFQEINSTFDPSSTWKPDAIFFPKNWNTATSEEDAEWVDLMEYIGEGGKKEVLYIEKREMWSDYSDKKARQTLVVEVENSCTMAGFPIRCKGWERDRFCMVFYCFRGFLCKNQKNPAAIKQCNTKTARPKSLEEKCRFGFAIFWDFDYGGWTLKGGLGCCTHTGHQMKAPDDVRQMVKNMPEEEEELAKDCFSVNSKADTVQALVQH